jgi:hypothetical protein
MSNNGEHVKFVNAAFDEREGDIILRGSIDPDSLPRLLVDGYQREVLPRKGSLAYWTEQLRRGFIPDIDLGMRGGAFREAGGAVHLLDPLYIVDGLQRRTAALEIARLGGTPRLGGTVRFNTTEAWERERFRILNMRRARVSPDLLLRNQARDSESLQMLLDLGQDSSFPLCRKVCWGQRMHRDELLHARILLKTAAILHAWMGTGLRGFSILVMASSLDRLIARVGRTTVRQNVCAFFGLVNDCWGATTVSSKKMAVCLRASFLQSLARVVADHENFWRDSEISVPLEMRRRLATLNIYHGYVINLCSQGGHNQQLYLELIEHMNKGMKTNRLVKRRDVEYDSTVTARTNLRIVESSAPAPMLAKGGE